MEELTIDSIYISDKAFRQILFRLNATKLDQEERQELIDRAVADLEGELVQRFTVPLTTEAGGAYENVAPFSRNIVLTALKSRIKSLIGIDQNRNVVIEQGQRYVDLHKVEFDSRIKMLLDFHRHYDFKLQPQALNAIDPIQSIGLARSDNRSGRTPDHDAI